jgi:hypothetical protein
MATIQKFQKHKIKQKIGLYQVKTIQDFKKNHRSQL